MGRRRRSALSLLLALALGAAGCGGGGVSNGATVSVYVGASLCAGAKRDLVRVGGRAGSVDVRAVCLKSEQSRGRLSLATIGRNARRAAEDSAAVAYLEAPDPAAARFAHPILESAGIAWVRAASGSSGMRRVLDAIRESNSASLRESVRESLHG